MNRFSLACLLAVGPLVAPTARAQYGPAGGGAPAAPTVRVATPTRGDVHRFVAQPGTIRPLQQATLYAKVSGYLKSIAVDKGDAVKAGALLAELEAPEVQADMARAQAELAKAQADFARADADLNRSGADIALATAGVAKAQADHVRGQAEVQQANSGVARARADLAVAKAEVAKAQAEFPRQAAELKLATAEHNRLTRARQQAPDLVTQSELDQALARLETTRALEASFKPASKSPRPERKLPTRALLPRNPPWPPRRPASRPPRRECRPPRPSSPPSGPASRPPPPIVRRPPHLSRLRVPMSDGLPPWPGIFGSPPRFPA